MNHKKRNKQSRAVGQQSDDCITSRRHLHSRPTGARHHAISTAAPLRRTYVLPSALLLNLGRRAAKPPPDLAGRGRIRPSLGRHDPPRSVVIARLIRAVARPPPAALLQPAAQRSCRPPCRLPRYKPPWRACMRRPVPHGHIRLRDHRIRSQQCRISTLHRGDGSPA